VGKTSVAEQVLSTDSVKMQVKPTSERDIEEAGEDR